MLGCRVTEQPLPDSCACCFAQVLNYARERKHFMPLWFSNVSTVIMFWTYIKAFWRSLIGKYFGGGIKFKTTLKVRGA